MQEIQRVEIEPGNIQPSSCSRLPQEEIQVEIQVEIQAGIQVEIQAGNTKGGNRAGEHPALIM